ncbi:MAG: triple tyrosine motif-containing protein, partial [Bacteroidota bacterium]
NGKVYNYTIKDGLNTNIIKSIISDKNQLWIGTDQGISNLKFKKHQIQEVKTYGKADGFAPIECLEKAALKDHEGNLWFGTIDGLMKYERNSFLNTTQPPRIYFTKIQTKGNQYSHLDKNLQMEAFENTINLSFKGNDLGTKGDLKYQWKLNDGPWSEVNDLNQVALNNLDHGRYTFQVKAINRIGNESEIKSFSFGIKQAIWEKMWVRLLALLSFAFLLFGFIKCPKPGK